MMDVRDVFCVEFHKMDSMRKSRQAVTGYVAPGSGYEPPKSVLIQRWR